MIMMVCGAAFLMFIVAAPIMIFVAAAKDGRRQAEVDKAENRKWGEYHRTKNNTSGKRI